MCGRDWSSDVCSSDLDVGVMSSFAIVCTVQVIAVSTGFPLLSRLLVPQWTSIAMASVSSCVHLNMLPQKYYSGVPDCIASTLRRARCNSMLVASSSVNPKQHQVVVNFTLWLCQEREGWRDGGMEGGRDGGREGERVYLEMGYCRSLTYGGDWGFRRKSSELLMQFDWHFRSLARPWLKEMPLSLINCQWVNCTKIFIKRNQSAMGWTHPVYVPKLVTSPAAHDYSKAQVQPVYLMMQHDRKRMLLTADCVYIYAPWDCSTETIKSYSLSQKSLSAMELTAVEGQYLIW